MDLITSHLIQLTSGLVFSLLLLTAAIILPEKKSVGFLLLLIPFQIITSRYGSVNVLMTYAVGAGLLFKGRIRQLPLLTPIIFIILAYLISTMTAPTHLLLDHLDYVFVICSNFVLFWVVYNVAKQQDNLRFFFNLLVVLNLPVLIYSFLQNILGLAGASFLGISELSIGTGMHKEVMYGPFQSSGIMAEYFVIQIFVLWHLLLIEQRVWRRILYISLIIANFALIIATGSRGAIFAMTAGGLLFIFFNRKHFFTITAIVQGLTISLFLAVTALFVISSTEFNTIYEKVEETRMIHGIPENRYKIWSSSWEQILQKPWTGHGPRFRLTEEKLRKKSERKRPLERQYPHNLYLFILYTTGILGLFAYGAFAAGAAVKLVRAATVPAADPFIGKIPLLAMAVGAVYFTDQMKISFLRFIYNDYQHFIFMLLAIFLAAADILLEKEGELGRFHEGNFRRGGELDNT